MQKPDHDTVEMKAAGKSERSGGSARAAWILVGLMLLAIGGLLAYDPESITDLFGSQPDEAPTEVYTGGATTGMGFLTVEGPARARVTLDGELLGPTPLTNRVVRSGEHRLVVKDRSGRVLLDRKLQLAPGARERIDLSASQH